MYFESNHIYHIYNRGNNSQNIFFTRDNYLFFLEKIRKHILPYADVLAWCLMPNHFHLMVYVKVTELRFYTVLGESQDKFGVEWGTVVTRERDFNHSNPVDGKLVKRPEEWEFSSYLDLIGLRRGSLVNRSKGKEFGLVLNENSPGDF